MIPRFHITATKVKEESFPHDCIARTTQFLREGHIGKDGINMEAIPDPVPRWTRHDTLHRSIFRESTHLGRRCVAGRR